MNIISGIANDIKTVARYRPKLMKRQIALNKLAPKAGDVAPDFTLYDTTGLHPVTLSDFRGRQPVALVFGSFT